MQNPSLGRGLTLEANVLEIARVPKGVEVALDRSLVVNVTLAAEDVGADGLSRNAAIPLNLDSDNNVRLLLRKGQPEQHKRHHQWAGDAQKEIAQTFVD
jgi:hypothetical protein